MMPHTIKGAILSFLGLAFVVLFAVNVFSGPKAAAQISVTGSHLTFSTLGVMALGLAEGPGYFNEGRDALGTQSYVSNYPKLQPKQPTAAQQLAKAKADLAKAKRDLAKAKKTQP